MERKGNKANDSPLGKRHGEHRNANPFHRKFLSAHDMPPTKFGRLAAHDPRFVLDLRMGREPRSQTEARIRGFMSGFEAARSDSAGEVAHVQ